MILSNCRKKYVVRFCGFAAFLFCVACLYGGFGSQSVYGADVQYVTPQMYGAVADGIHDDTDALQNAIDSGYPVLLPDGEYYITDQIRVYDKKNLWVQGSANAVIRRAYDPIKRVFLFNLQRCDSCMFKNLNITSDIKGIGVVPYGHTRPSRASSNVLAFGGNSNSNIYFYDNSFTNMESDYWFNDPKDGWDRIYINGWTSRDSVTALFGQYCTNIKISNADIILNSKIAGDGDHCIYLAEGSSGIKIKDSYFDAGDGAYGEGSPGAVFTFYKTSNAASNAYVGDISFENCTIRGGRFLYGNCGIKETISADNCTFEQVFSRGKDYTGAFGGNTNYIISNSTIKVTTYTLTGEQISDTSIIFYRCDINAEELDTVCFANPANLWVIDCNIQVGKMLLYTHEQNSRVNVTISNCDVTASGTSYLLSKRNRKGTVTVTNCTFKNSSLADNLVYNGNSADMTGFKLSNCRVDGYKTIATDKNIKNATIEKTWLNGKLFK